MTTNNPVAEPDGVVEALNALFGLLSKDTRGHWYFNSLSRNASKFQSAIEALDAFRASTPDSTAQKAQKAAEKIIALERPDWNRVADIITAEFGAGGEGGENSS